MKFKEYKNKKIKHIRHLLSIADLSKAQIMYLLKLAKDLKKNPNKYHTALYEKVLLTFFQMPSLRTEVSFDVAMFKMGGEIVDYHSENSPWAHGKESIEDVGRVLSRYVDCVMVRMHEHNELVKLAKNSSVPVINGLTSYEHPCQILSDLQTIIEKFGRLDGLKLSYIGDSFNNVTHSLIYAGAIMGMDISIGCPAKKEYSPDPVVVKKAKQLAKKYKNKNFKLKISSEPFTAAKDSHIIYTDSWMSYRIDPKMRNKRIKDLKKYQITGKIMRIANKKAIFMHCLPALRGMEVAKQVIDGKQSVVFDQAENRMHMEKAILLWLMKK